SQSVSDNSLDSTSRFLTDLQIVGGISFIPLAPADGPTNDETVGSSDQSEPGGPPADRLLLDNLFGSFFNELSPFKIQETKQDEPGTSSDGTAIQERAEPSSRKSIEGSDVLPDTVFVEGDDSESTE